MKTGRRVVLIVVVIILAVCVGTAVLLGRQYYNDRYVSSDYYTMVPLDYDMTPAMKYTDDNEEMGLAMTYRLTAYNDQGEAKQVEFDLLEEGSGWANSGPYLQPGTFLLVKASEQLVTGWELIDREDVPAKALEAIEAS